MKEQNLDLKFSHVPLGDNIINLRHEILRSGLPRDSATFEGDDLPTTLHFVAYKSQAPDSPVCCVSYFLSDWEGVQVLQLRGMATSTAFQRKGVGAALLRFAEDLIQKQKGLTIFWCNARIEAVGFYEKQGWACFGEKFDMLGVGPHIKMTKGFTSL